MSLPKYEVVELFGYVLVTLFFQVLYIMHAYALVNKCMLNKVNEWMDGLAEMGGTKPNSPSEVSTELKQHCQ